MSINCRTYVFSTGYTFLSLFLFSYSLQIFISVQVNYQYFQDTFDHVRKALDDIYLLSL